MLSERYDNRDNFDFDIENFPFWMVTVSVVPLMGYISQLIKFVRICNHVSDSNARNIN